MLFNRPRVLALPAATGDRVGLRICLGLLAVALVAACEPMLRVSGTVRDPGGQPLEHVSVTLKAEGRGPHPTTTDKDGAFHVSIVGAERAVMTFSKDGYHAAVVEVRSKAPPLSVVLEPAARSPSASP